MQINEPGHYSQTNGQHLTQPVPVRYPILDRIKRGHFFLPEDRRCEYMGMLGFSNEAIRNHLNLTDGQIQRRLKAANIKRTDYRNMRSGVSREVVRRLDVISERNMVRHIERHLLKG
jgi:hypothetical protein